MSIRVSEAASAQDEAVAFLTLSQHHGVAADSHGCSESELNAVESSASCEATEAAQGQKAALSLAGHAAAHPKTPPAPMQQSSTGAACTANAEQHGKPILPDGTGTASAESLPPGTGCSPVSRGLGGGPSKSWGLPLPWPLPSWRPPTTTAATPAAISNVTVAATTSNAISAASSAAISAATIDTALAASRSIAVPAAISAASSASTPAATLAATQAHLTADSPPNFELSLADTAFQSHAAASEALTSPNMLQDSASPWVTAQACTSGLSSESAQTHEAGHTGGSVPGSDSAQCCESAQFLEADRARELGQQPHEPDSVVSSGSLKHQRLVTAASLSVAPSTDADTDAGVVTDGVTDGVTDAVTDAHPNTAAASQYEVQHRHYDHLNLGLGIPSQLEEPFSERTASDTPSCPQVAAHDSAVVAQVAAPESANLAQVVACGSADITDSTELAGMKPEQKALLAKGLQLCMQVHQVHPSPPSTLKPLQAICS